MQYHVHQHVTVHFHKKKLYPYRFTRRVIEYEVTCHANTGYQYSIFRSNSQNNANHIPVQSNFLPNVAVVDAPSGGNSGNSIGGPGNGGSGNGGSGNSLNTGRRRRMLQVNE